MDKTALLQRLRSGGELSSRDRFGLVMILALPSILAQLAQVLMSYIDAGMVGRLGSSQAAAVGLVSTSTWLFGGFCMATSSGFSVQVAQLIGAGDFARARRTMRQGFTTVLGVALLLALAGVALAGPLPHILGGSEEILPDASAYFRVFALFLPVMGIGWSASSFLIASGNTKIPGILNMASCLLDVGFNYLFIWGLGMGVKGAAIGTGLATACTAAAMLYFLLLRSPELRIRGEKASWLPNRSSLSPAWKISAPMYLQNIISRGAYIMCTFLVAPLGNIAIAANSFAIIAESFCYLPGRIRVS